MTTRSAPESSTVAGVRRSVLWFALLGGAIAWTAHLLLAYGVAEFGCVAGWGKRLFLGINLVAWIILVLSVILLAVAVASTVVAFRIRRTLRGSADDESVAVDLFISRFGLISGALFSSIILVESVPIFYFLGDC